MNGFRIKLLAEPGKESAFLKQSKKKWLKLGLLVGCMLICLLLFCIWQNNDLVLTSLIYRNPDLPEELEGLRIVQLSDLHNKEFGTDQSRLLCCLRKAEPDLIVVTGDLIDRDSKEWKPAIVLLRSALELAPVYYVSGNHEKLSGRYADLRQDLLDAGIVVLEEESVMLSLGETKLNILGLQDVGFYASEYESEDEWRNACGRNLSGLRQEASGDFTILLSHRPELADLYEGQGVDLVFAGHAHGGQIRLPFLGGLYAPGQGWLPSYTSGLYSLTDMDMVVSRGLGNSAFPIRIGNRPEVVVVTLTAQQEEMSS